MTDAPIFWFTGLSGAGKTTLAEAVRDRLAAMGMTVLILDGDQVREEFHRDLGFTPEDIRENNRLIAELCAMRRDECDAILVPVISPFRDARAAALARLAPGFFEIHISAGLDTVAARDVKGLYARSRDGAIGPMIGAPGGVPYEPPERADLVVDSAAEMPAASAARLTAFVFAHMLPGLPLPCPPAAAGTGPTPLR
jgi:adenylyl-sulfate kinase